MTREDAKQQQQQWHHHHQQRATRPITKYDGINTNDDDDEQQRQSTQCAIDSSEVDPSFVSPPTSSSSSLSPPSPPPPDAASVRHYRLQWLSFFLLGTLNNLSYVVINSAAKSLADSFNQGNLIGAVVWCNVGFGIAVRAFNTFYLLETSYSRRIIASLIMMIGGCLGVAFGTWINFWFCLCGVILVGCFSSLGESVILGFLKNFNPELMGAWSSGTGMAGVAGTLMYLLMFSVIGMSNRTIFFTQAPFCIVYWWAFRYVNRGIPDPIVTKPIAVSMRRSRRHTDEDSPIDEPSMGVDRDDDETSLTVASDDAHTSIGESAKLSLLVHEGSPVPNEHGRSDSIVVDDDDADVDATVSRVVVGGVSDVADDPAILSPSSSLTVGAADETETLAEQEYYARETSFARVMRVSRTIASPATQLAAVYFFEYVVSVGFASKANPDPPPGDWWRQNAYELLALCYQIGVLIARSSVNLIKIRAIHWLTILQAGQFALWFIHTKEPFLPLWFQFVDMIFVGLLGGAMYVNVFYILVSPQSNLRAPDRELGINLTAIGVNIGIVMSSIVEIVLFLTILS